MNGASNIFQVFQLYNGRTWIFPFFLAAAAYVLVRADKENRRNALLMIASALLFVFNDAAYRIAGKVGEAETYYRFLWMIPVVPILAYVIVDLILRQKTAFKKILVIVVSAAVIFAAGDPYSIKDLLRKPENVHYVDAEAEAVCGIISADKEEERPIVASPFPLVLSMRLCDPTVRNAILRSTYLAEGEVTKDKGYRKRQRRMYLLVSGKEVNAKEVRKALKKCRVNYVVIAKEYERESLMEEIGWTIVGETPSYTVFKPSSE